ncbi:hypothetical protein SASPL_116030 [Salvia splendens]|uniref:Uncharacterized protein n=1 Tax=Salvia splendens TaxID=180675 RepID=A0A8X8Y6J1_SALSN|nr:hypothetical protein SASPL_116030 [Salvia splendens]
MAGEFNPGGFHHLYKSGGGGTSSGSSGEHDLIPVPNYYGGSLNLGGMQYFSSAAGPSSSSSSPLLLDSVPGLKHDTGLAVEWSVEEQYKLEEGLAKSIIYPQFAVIFMAREECRCQMLGRLEIGGSGLESRDNELLMYDTELHFVRYEAGYEYSVYAHEPYILQYIKIAASLQDKTVRDVALRCRWMMRKRRKQQDLSFGKKMKEGKVALVSQNKLMEASLKNKVSSAPPLNLPAYSLPSNHHNQSEYIFSGVLSYGVGHLLEENNHAFGQISTNLSTLKVVDSFAFNMLYAHDIWRFKFNTSEAGARMLIADEHIHNSGHASWVLVKYGNFAVKVQEAGRFSSFVYVSQRNSTSCLVERGSEIFERLDCSRCSRCKCRWSQSVVLEA